MSQSWGAYIAGRKLTGRTRETVHTSMLAGVMLLWDISILRWNNRGGRLIMIGRCAWNRWKANRAVLKASRLARQPGGARWIWHHD